MRIRLKEILDYQNVSVYALSKEIGVSQNNLGKIIKGETTSIKYDILEKLCVALRVTPNDIFIIDYPYSYGMVKDVSDPTLIAYNEYLENFDPNESYNIINDLDEETRAEIEIQNNTYAMESNLKYTLDESISNFILKLVEYYISIEKIDEHTKFVFRDYKVYDYFTTGYKVKTYYDKLDIFLKKDIKNTSISALLLKIKNIYENDKFEKLSIIEIEQLQKEIDYYFNNDILKQKD
jgi:putative transcriptional regulator